MEQYVVTGMGIYNGLGHNVSTSFTSLVQGQSAIKELIWPEDDPLKFPATHAMLRPKVAALSSEPSSCPLNLQPYWGQWDKNTKSCLMAVDEAVAQSRLTSTNVGVVVSTFGAGTTLRLEIFAAMNNGVKRMSPRKILNIGLDYPAAMVAAVYGVTGPNTSMDSACTTGLTSIDSAINTLKANSDLDAMIVGAADHMAEPIYTYWFQNLNALSLSADPETSSRPFDKDRNGFVMGEGAGAIIIEPLSKAKKRGAKIYGVVRSCGFVTLYDSDTSPDINGRGAIQCVEQAVRKAGIEMNQIDFINAHATSTPIGDQVEYDAMVKLLPNTHMVSNKGQIGHTMSASGLIETIYTLQSMIAGTVPGNSNLTQPIGSEMILPTQSTKLDIKFALKNSFGFGGRNACLLLERYDD